MDSIIFILGCLINVLISRTDAYKCLSCKASARPRDCESVQECGPHEKCSIESYLTTSGYIRYDLGCMDIYKCAAFGSKRAVLNATVVEEIKQKDTFSVVPDEQWDINNRDSLICADCCTKDLCNAQGCGEPGYPSDSGLICYNCEQAKSPDACNQIKLCNRDEVCHFSFNIMGTDLVYRSECTSRQTCRGILDIEPIIGRRRKSIEMIRRRKRALQCNKCCSNNLCNVANCTSSPHINAISNPPMTTLPPVFSHSVNGNWLDWGLWSACSATCGSSAIRSRSRTCTYSAPSSGGTNCIGMATDVESCNTGACPVDGNWYYWGPWSDCTATCGSSVTRSQTRDCTNPAPSAGGANCIGTRVETMSCNLVDGQWASWTMWSSCSVTCGTGGISSRQRNCDNPRPSATGLSCSGESYEIRQCSGPNGPQVIQSAHNYSRSLGSQVVIKCLEHVIFPLQQALQVTWTVPQIVGYPVPSNLEYFTDGSLIIHGLRAENCGPYFCTLTTDCGSYDSPYFYVAIY